MTGAWPRVTVVDRRQSDPHDGVLARESLDAAAPRARRRRAGRGRRGVCNVSATVVCWPAPSAANSRDARSAHRPKSEVDGQLACRDRHEPRANFCRNCGATNLKRLRIGVTTLARDVAAQLGQAVSEVTASSALDATLERVVVGTEAVWQRVRHCGVVIFVDFDQYLLAPSASARHSAITAVGKAGPTGRTTSRGSRFGRAPDSSQ